MGKMSSLDGMKPPWQGLKNKRKAKMAEWRKKVQRREEAKERERLAKSGDLDAWADQFRDDWS
jgi:hypothetical protein